MSKSNNDIVIKELMQKVEAQKKALGTKERGVLTTNGIFKFDDSHYFNINTVSDVSQLIRALSYLLLNEEFFRMACSRLGVSNVSFEWQSYKVADWEKDFAMRIRQIEYEKNKKRLEDTQKKLAALVSEEERTAMEIENIRKALE